MKTPLKIAILTLAALALQQPSFSEGVPNRRITLHGEHDPYLAEHIITDAVLRVDRSYIITNNTRQTITVMLVEDRTPLDYFPMLAGETRQFDAPWNVAGDDYSLDLFLRGNADANLNGRNGIRLVEAPEFEN